MKYEVGNVLVTHSGERVIILAILETNYVMFGGKRERFTFSSPIDFVDSYDMKEVL